VEADEDRGVIDLLIAMLGLNVRAIHDEFGVLTIQASPVGDSICVTIHCDCDANVHRNAALLSQNGWTGDRPTIREVSGRRWAAGSRRLSTPSIVVDIIGPATEIPT
jgi:hypothetical protein